MNCFSSRYTRFAGKARLLFSGARKIPAAEMAGLVIFAVFPELGVRRRELRCDRRSFPNAYSESTVDLGFPKVARIEKVWRDIPGRGTNSRRLDINRTGS